MELEKFEQAKKVKENLERLKTQNINWNPHLNLAVWVLRLSIRLEVNSERQVKWDYTIKRL